jgi:restriction endonuclease
VVSQPAHEQLITEYVGALEAGGSKKLSEVIATRVEEWLRARFLPVEDISFTSWLEHWDCPSDDSRVALAMCTESSTILGELEGGRQREWADFLASLDLDYSFHDHVTLVFYPMNVTVRSALRDVTDFEWATRLVAPDFAAIYSDVFTYFADRTDRLERLHWREFEELLASIFTAQGYKTTLGKGTADEGVDIRLVENAVYGELVTLVQVKRYNKKRPINLEKVAALAGVVHHKDADKAIFVTTSRYLPSARKFAEQHARPIKLVTGNEVALWCEVISSQRSQSDWLRTAARNYRLDPDKVVVARVGYGIFDHKFACIVAETPLAIRVAPLAEKRQFHRDDWTLGWVEPDLSIPLDRESATITARRMTHENKLLLDKDGSFLGDDSNLYTIWDHQPKWYDLND